MKRSLPFALKNAEQNNVDITLSDEGQQQLVQNLNLNTSLPLNIENENEKSCMIESKVESMNVASETTKSDTAMQCISDVIDDKLSCKLDPNMSKWKMDIMAGQCDPREIPIENTERLQAMMRTCFSVQAKEENTGHTQFYRWSRYKQQINAERKKILDEKKALKIAKKKRRMSKSSSSNKKVVTDIDDIIIRSSLKERTKSLSKIEVSTKDFMDTPVEYEDMFYFVEEPRISKNFSYSAESNSKKDLKSTKRKLKKSISSRKAKKQTSSKKDKKSTSSKKSKKVSDIKKSKKFTQKKSKKFSIENDPKCSSLETENPFRNLNLISRSLDNIMQTEDSYIIRNESIQYQKSNIQLDSNCDIDENSNSLSLDMWSYSE